MKIIYRGTPSEERIWKGTCYWCDSILEAQQKELAIVYAQSQRDTDFAKSDCPVCKKPDCVTFYLKPI